MRVLAVIPARWGATRFPGKALTPILGRPMLAWVVDAVRAAERVDEVAVVTDHAAIARTAEAAGARAVVIAREASSGSDRIAHLLAADSAAADASVIVNVQGDEPLLEATSIDRAVALLDRENGDIGTLAREVREGEDATDPNLVKVALTADGRALYFSRFPVPHGGETWIHLGVYAYRRPAFDRFVAGTPSPLERAERLEQLRALELGLVIRCAVVVSESISVDVPEDVERVEAVLRRRLDGGGDRV